MNEAVAAPAAAGAQEPETWFGQPRGLVYLFMTEMWERFSFYGMRALLILYMVQELLLPGHIENVAGMQGFRTVLEGALGPMSTQAFASQVFGLYSGLVYLTPIFGGWLADRFFGARKVVLAGIALMTAGHFAMAFEWSVLIALTLLVLGSGCLKGNIAAQVGQLYAEGESANRAQGFAIFSTGINIGAMLGPFACALLAQIYGWDAGFGAAGIMMLFAAGVYLAGQRHFRHDRPVHRVDSTAPKLSGDQWIMVAIIALVILLGVFFSFPYDQLANVGIIWADQHVDLSTPFGDFPAAWFSSVDPLGSTIFIPFLIAYWRSQTARGKGTDDLHKIAIGSLLIALACCMLAAGAWLAAESGGKVPVWVALAAFTLTGVSFMWYWPVTLAFVSRHAPPQVKALMMAGAYLSAFCSGIGSGYVGRFYEPMGPTGFWLLNAGFGIAGALAVFASAPLLRRSMARLEVRAASSAV